MSALPMVEPRRGGRPPKAPETRKDVIITVRVSVTEHEELTAIAQARDLTISDLTRQYFDALRARHHGRRATWGR